MPATLQGDRAIIDILRLSGANVYTTRNGCLSATAEKLLPQTVDVSGIPDLVPPLAALFAFCEGESRLLNAGRLRHKESDRIVSVVSGLKALGASIRIEGDNIIIRGVDSLPGGNIDSCNDHRIAMMGAVAAIRCDGPVIVEGGDCVAKSYPSFWRDFEKAVRTAATAGDIAECDDRWANL